MSSVLSACVVARLHTARHDAAIVANTAGGRTVKVEP
jgi:hypothetical protein